MVQIQAGTETSTGFTVEWTAPTSFGKNAEGEDVDANKVQYRVYYTEKQGSTKYTAQTILDDAAHTTSNTVAGTTNPLQVAISSLKPGTLYAVMVATHYADSPTTVSYSAVVELSTGVPEPTPPFSPIEKPLLSKMKTYTFTVTWNNGPIQGKKVNGSTLVANEISYEIHYAWEKKIDAAGRSAPVTIEEIQNMGTHKTHEIIAQSTLPTTSIVKEYMGADQRVYVYVKAINSTDRTKHTVSAVQHYDTAIAYTQIAAPGISNGSHTVALKRGGSVWAWGWNKYGQLGYDTKDDDHRKTPGIIDE